VHWVHVLSGHGEQRSTGFHLDLKHVVTARHCIQDCSLGLAVEIIWNDDSRYSAVVIDEDPLHDLTLLRIEGTLPPFDPSANFGVPSQGRPWASRASDDLPDVGGSVQTAEKPLRCRDGNRFVMIQLQVSTDLGNYASYSGSAVQQADVIGLLVSQLPQMTLDGRASAFASSVLYAVPYGAILALYQRAVGPKEPADSAVSNVQDAVLALPEALELARRQLELELGREKLGLADLNPVRPLAIDLQKQLKRLLASAPDASDYPDPPDLDAVRHDLT
jgi:hypothetical protein